MARPLSFLCFAIAMIANAFAEDDVARFYEEGQ